MPLKVGGEVSKDSLVRWIWHEQNVSAGHNHILMINFKMGDSTLEHLNPWVCALEELSQM